jgi:predicted nucleic acid-binding protein
VYVIDTYVVLKRFVERGEADVTQARSLREAFVQRKCRLSAPNLLFVELANAVAVGQGQRPAEVKAALALMKDIDLTLAPVGWESLNRAVEFAVTKRIAVYDGCFLTLAVELGCLLVTADQGFLRRLGPHPNVVARRELRLAD